MMRLANNGEQGEGFFLCTPLDCTALDATTTKRIKYQSSTLSPVLKQSLSHRYADPVLQPAVVASVL